VDQSLTLLKPPPTEELKASLNQPMLPLQEQLFHTFLKLLHTVDNLPTLIALTLPQMVELLPQFQELPAMVDILLTLLTHQLPASQPQAHTLSPTEIP
jgi:hypothetical protein